MTTAHATTVFLKKGRDASLQRHHPWVFSGGIERIVGTPSAGDVVRVVDNRGSLLGVGAYSPSSQIRVRLFSFVDETIDREFFKTRIARAFAKRELRDPENTACRLIYGESDHLPGLIVDKYKDVLVCQFLFAGLEHWKPVLVELLTELSGCTTVYERSDTNSRDKEGLPQTTGVLAGAAPSTPVMIIENGMHFGVDIVTGQKTGFFLDQADNRQYVRRKAAGKSVLNCFAYTGGFSVAALLGGASHVVSIDSSAPALALAESNLLANGIDPSRHEAVNANVFHLLRDYQQSGKLFDMIILDPPKFAENKNQVNKAARAYKDLALQASRLLVPGGLLVTFSCSGSIDLNLFQKITFDALLDANRQGEIIKYLHQGADHPIALEFPESQYLKGLACRLA